jgi:hypothetical protein
MLLLPLLLCLLLLATVCILLLCGVCKTLQQGCQLQLVTELCGVLLT